MTIRGAHPADLTKLNEMITLLSAHHGDAVQTSPQTLERDLFGPIPWVRALVTKRQPATMLP